MLSHLPQTRSHDRDTEYSSEKPDIFDTRHCLLLPTAEYDFSPDHDDGAVF